MTDPKPVTDEASFEQLWTWFKERVQKVFEKAGEHEHIVAAILPNGHLQLVFFNDFLAMFEERFRSDGLPEDKAYQRAKLATYMSLAEGLKTLQCVGYFEVCEGWTLTFPSETKPEEIATAYEQVIRQYGRLANVPTKAEILSVKSRYRERTRFAAWKIGRRGDDVWLHDHEENERRDRIGRASLLDDAIDEVLGIRT